MEKSAGADELLPITCQLSGYTLIKPLATLMLMHYQNTIETNNLDYNQIFKFIGEYNNVSVVPKLQNGHSEFPADRLVTVYEHLRIYKPFSPRKQRHALECMTRVFLMVHQSRSTPFSACYFLLLVYTFLFAMVAKWFF